jgi:putative transposase
LRLRMRELARSRPRFSYRRLHVLLRREGWAVNHKRVRRLYRLEGLQLRMRVRRRKHIALHRGSAPAATRRPGALEHGLCARRTDQRPAVSHPHCR